MDKVILKLKDLSQAPWGLFTEGFPPQPLVWLTELEPVVKIDRAALTDSDISKIWSDTLRGIVVSKNLFIDNEESKIPVQDIKSNIFDVAALMKEEKIQASKRKQFLETKYPQLDNILAMPAAPLKKKLKAMAKTAAVPFFQEAKKREEASKNRKTVIAVLVDIIQKKIAVVGLASSVNAITGESMVADSYYDLIEEFPDEEEEVELPVSSKKVVQAGSDIEKDSLSS